METELLLCGALIVLGFWLCSSGSVLFGILSIGTGFYLIIPAWPITAINFTEKMITQGDGAIGALAPVLAAIAGIVIIIYGLKKILSL